MSADVNGFSCRIFCLGFCLSLYSHYVFLFATRFFVCVNSASCKRLPNGSSPARCNKSFSKPRQKRTLAYMAIVTLFSPFSTFLNVARLIPARSASIVVVILRRKRASLRFSPTSSRISSRVGESTILFFAIFPSSMVIIVSKNRNYCTLQLPLRQFLVIREL